jgi:hypothetical protein
MEYVWISTVSSTKESHSIYQAVFDEEKKKFKNHLMTVRTCTAVTNSTAETCDEEALAFSPLVLLKNFHRQQLVLATVLNDLGFCYERLLQGNIALACYYRALLELTRTSITMENERIDTADSSFTWTNDLVRLMEYTKSPESPPSVPGSRFLIQSIRRGVSRLQRF